MFSLDNLPTGISSFGFVHSKDDKIKKPNLPPNPYVDKTHIPIFRDWDDKPTCQCLMMDDNQQQVFFPVRRIQIKSITECSNGYLLESTEKKSKDKNQFCQYILSHELFEKLKDEIKKGKELTIVYKEKSILKQDLKINISPPFDKVIGGISVHQKNNRKAFYREIELVYLSADIAGIDFM